MKNYEAMFIVKPDLSEADQKTLLTQISDAVVKNKGKVGNAAVWSERKRLFFPIKKYREGIYFLMTFSIDPLAVKDISHAYGLNENILRILITTQEK